MENKMEKNGKKGEKNGKKMERMEIKMEKIKGENERCWLLAVCYWILILYIDCCGPIFVIHPLCVIIRSLLSARSFFGP